MNDVKKNYNMQVLDRHTKNVIYKTIKQIINTAKEEKKKAHIMSIQLDWEEFRKFTPMQIMGLLLLREVFSMDVFQQIYKERPNYLI